MCGEHKGEQKAEVKNDARMIEEGGRDKRVFSPGSDAWWKTSRDGRRDLDIEEGAKKKGKVGGGVL